MADRTSQEPAAPNPVSAMRIAVFRKGNPSKWPVASTSVAQWVDWQRAGKPAGGSLEWPGNAQEWRTRKTWAELTGDDDCLQAQTAAYRAALAAAADETAVKDIKGWKADNLPCVTWGWQGDPDPVRGTSLTGPRAKTRARAVNPLICFDVDGVADESGAVSARNGLLALPSVAAAGVAVSGRGVWFVVVLSRAPADHEDYKVAWWFTAHALVREHGMRLERLDPKTDKGAGSADSKPSNVVSLRFGGHDPGAWLRPDGEITPFDLPAALPTEAESVAAIAALLRGADPSAAAPEPEPEPAPGPKPKRRKKMVVPAHGGRPSWVAAAEAEGGKRHDRMLAATLHDVREGRVPDEDRIGEYSEALGGGREDEVQRAVDGAETLVADEAPGPGRAAPAGGGLDKFGNPYPHLPLPQPDLFESVNADGDRVLMAKADSIADSEARLAVLLDETLPAEEALCAPAKGVSAVLPEWRTWQDPPDAGEAARRAEVRAGGIAVRNSGGWSVEQTGGMIAYAAAAGRQVLGKNTKDGGFVADARTGGSAATGKRGLSLLSASMRRQAPRSTWDTRRTLLGLPDGQCLEITADGWQTRPQSASERITRSLPCAPAADWRGGPFEAVIKRTPEPAWLQRAFGYALVGGGAEPVCVWLKGPRQSGKSTLVGYMSGALGGTAPESYARAVAPDLLLTKRGQRHLQEIARLQGSRMVTWSEAKAGGVLDTEEVKRWCSGGQDPLTGNLMRENAIDFTPMFLLVMVSNEDLLLSAPDPALSDERMRLIDGWQTIPKEDRSISHGWRAKAGDPQALAWVAEGAVGYLRSYRNSGKTGLLPETDGMKAAREAWAAASNPVARFVGERIMIDRDGYAFSAEAFEVYDKWAQEQGHRLPLTRPTFTTRMGAELARLTGDQSMVNTKRVGPKLQRGRGWQGVRIRAEFDAGPDDDADCDESVAPAPAKEPPPALPTLKPVERRAPKAARTRKTAAEIAAEQARIAKGKGFTAPVVACPTCGKHAGDPEARLCPDPVHAAASTPSTMKSEKARIH